MALNFNTNPYYDDFDEDKNFQRILFRPGRAVQARELTQSQTILQNQIDRFGKHIFQEGSKVTGGQTFDETVLSVKLQPTYSGNTINISGYAGYYAFSTSTNSVYQIKKAEVADTVDPNTLFLSFIKRSGNTVYANANGYVSNSETLRIYSSGDLAPANIISNVITSNTETAFIARLFHVAEGVFFTNGHFVKTLPQTVIVSKYSNDANVTVGFDVSESIVESSSDSSLLDPAIGASNYIAPGADRYKIVLTLSVKDIVDNSITDLTSSNYIEIARYREGVLVKDTQIPIYSEIAKTLARRTFDESGNYRVDGLEPRVPKNKFSDDANTTFSLDISSGKAYVEGYEVDKPTQNILIINKARDYETVSGYDVPAYYGNYFYVTTANGAIFNFSTAEKLEIHSNNGNFGASTKIAEAYPKNIEYVSGNGSSSVYKLFLFNIVKTSNTPLDLANCIIANTSTSVNGTCNIHSSSIITRSIAGTFSSANPLVNVTSSSGITIGMRVDGAGFTFPTYVTAINGNQITINQNPTISNTLQTLTFSSSYLTDTNFEESVFESSYDVIKQFSQVNYYAKRVFKSVSFINGVASVQTNDGTERFANVSGANLQKHYAICIRTPGSSYSRGQWVDLSGGTYITVPSPSVGSPATLNIDLADSGFNGTADILTTLDITAAARRTKTLSQNNIKYFTVLDSANTFSLGYSDVINVSAIYIASGSNIASNANVNVVGSFTIDYGQKGSFYDHATIKLKTGASVNTGNTMVVFDRYTHSGTGFFDTLSYPTYNTIPSYTKTNGVTIDLRDSIDFRPIRSANTTSNVYSNLSMSFASQQIVDSIIGSVDTDVEYYLPRNDKVILRKNGSFAVLEGVSALNNPPVPNDEPGAMTLYTLELDPYTYNTSNVTLKIENNRRYTMKDIGAIDTRLRRMEYYTALNLLERDVVSTTYYDDQDNQLFNNGFVVDPFRGHSIGDVFSADYKCSIDYDNQVLRPKFEANGTSLTLTSNSLSVTDNVLSLSYTSVPYITQNIASQTVNVNPFSVIGFVGYVKLAKDTASWVDFTSRPDVLVNINKDLDNYELGTDFKGTQWNNWNILGYTDDSNIIYTYYSVTGQVVQTTTNSGVKQNDSAIIENKILEFVPGNLNIDFELFGMRPNTEIATYFDSTQITSYSRVYEANAYGNIVSVTANTGAVGPAAAACTYTLILSNGNVDNTSAQVSVTTASTGEISSISILNPGLYSSVPMANTFGNTEFTITINANTPGYTANSLVTDLNGYLKGRLQVPNEISSNLFVSYTLPDKQDYKLTVGRNHLYFCDNRTSMRNATTLAETYFFSANPPKKKPPAVIQSSSDLPSLTVNPTKHWKIVMQEIAIQTLSGQHQGRGPGLSNDWLGPASDATGGGGYDQIIYDTTGQATSAVEAAAALVEALYAGLGRDADQDGYSFWVTTAAAEGADPAWVEAAFAEAAQNNGECYKGDPLAQTFFVNEFTNPEGIFIESIDLYFATKDDTGIPVMLELRPTVNGYPSSDKFIADSQVIINPEDVNIPSNPNVPVATRFKFNSPIYLEPGEHSFVVLANSDKYTVYVGTIGQQRIDGVGPIVSQPYVGLMFKSQNASTWVPDNNSDMCFVINQCKFDTDVAQFAVLNPVALNYDQLYEVAKINAPYDAISQSANVTFSLATKNNGGSLGNYAPVIPNSNIILDQRKVLNNSTDANIRVVMSTTNPDVTPVLDISRCSFTIVKNLLDSPAAANVTSYPETLPSGGGALSKYIMRKVTLTEGFDATGLRVFLQQNLPQGSSVQVYYRVLSGADSDKIENKSWTLMTQTNVSSTNQNFFDYYDYEYKVNNISYTSGGVTYKDFKTFAIKIVFYSTNPANAPTAKNLRVIALS